MAEGDDFKQLAKDFRAAHKTVIRKVSGALTRHTNAVDARAKGLAPKDRPWLSTEGITHDTRGLARRVHTVIDPTRTSKRHPEGEDIGMDVEFGTSHQQPHPFLLPAFQVQEQPFIADLSRILGEVAQ